MCYFIAKSNTIVRFCSAPPRTLLQNIFLFNFSQYVLLSTTDTLSACIILFKKLFPQTYCISSIRDTFSQTIGYIMKKRNLSLTKLRKRVIFAFFCEKQKGKIKPF